MTKLPSRHQPTPNPESPLPHPSSSSSFFSSTIPTFVSNTHFSFRCLRSSPPFKGRRLGVGMVSDLGCDELGKGQWRRYSLIFGGAQA
ncbi:hypothetical protein GBA52_015708 [Prunus armeniaca]|nr:hypothetical protein GBA52_015708 [Prunus armeniaca]